MNKNKGLGILFLFILAFLLIESINTFNFSHADSGFDTGYSSGGYSGGYSGGSYDFDVDTGSHGSGGGIFSSIAMIVLGLIVLITFIVKSIEKGQINKEIRRQQDKDDRLKALSNDVIKDVDENLDIQMLGAIAKSAYEKYAKNISKPNRLQSIFTNEFKEKFDFENNRKRTIENIEFVEIKIIDIRKDKYLKFKAYYIVKCNDYTKEENKDKVVYNKIIFSLINIDDLWLIEDIED
jgi:hypothetical protein